MECEICGKPVPENNPIKAKIEGSVMVVCKECSKLGKIQKAPPKPKYVKQNKTKRPTTTRNKPYSRNDEPSEELIEDFNVEVRKAREAKNWSREVLGKKINERVSVINRIEAGKMTPDTKLTRKLENTLGITLLEKVDKIDLNQFMSYFTYT
ncbi:multiprotein bridging factor aMBF1 [uncultured Methanobrevibacter sp.]|uniref:multiprotein bridging factor aMBF1 n=1 Tax=uncultured Methanobrevibacter sp. TaxID=253161 RepID=UPI0025F6F96E|nr:multiprotein bridging factor aMBF1 [uncultured Methanobrevibacter sp.]